MSELNHRAPQAPLRTLADIHAFEHEPGSQQLAADTTYDVLRQAAARHPQRTALRFVLSGAADAPEFCFSYQHLLDGVTQAANAFHHAGIAPGKAVALLLPNLPETHFALWGAQAAGIASPLNPLLEAEHLASLVEATRAEVLVTLAAQPEGDLWHKALAVIERCPSIRTVLVVDLDAYVAPAARAGLQALRAKAPLPQRPGVEVLSFSAALATQPADRLVSGRVIRPDDLCAYFHTGGTTGLPKIAVHTHLNEAFVAAMLQALEPDPHVVLCGLPLFHVNGALVTGLGAFHGGWEVVLLTPQGYRGPGVMARFWHLVERFGATSFSAVPTIFAGLAALPHDGADITSLRHAFCGAAPLPAEVARQFEAHAGIPLCEGYGLTEAACISAVNPPGFGRRPGSVGLRLPHQRLQAWKLDADGQASEPCAAGEVGVIGVSGPNVFPGYLRESDNRGIWLSPGWLNTGDLGYLDQDGFVHLTGRAKDLIIRGGHNIDPAMVEDALLRHPAVALAAAVGQPDEHAGELPVAYVTLKPGASIDSAALLAAARELVPERAAVPARIEILPQMALTAVGKVAKAELRLRAAEHVLGQLLTQHGLAATVRMVADAARGSVARLRCPGHEAGRAQALLERFPYPVELVIGTETP
ncbi:acyl-CoA synthetase [Rugamonas apoptosis]|uniref:Acyl-CoA synthetase n=1 Tax=Rugamonas apoptosis TaxID=2758570 RepID=A0A7W2FE11_9BURK|nr:acyl-CoA synthetase [Rugamonas apoptosis]MBA5689909.1 acyl-CoA synthetase [Rugamonas apoptosis]